jgi:hypothetical protein
MAGRKRSGLQSHLRAYGCACKPRNNSSCPIIKYITLSEIATYNSLNKTWTLNKNTIIQKCEVLILPDDNGQTFFVIDGITLVNYGVIYSNIYSSNVVGISVLNGGNLINYNKVIIGNTDVHIYNSGKLINNGSLMNGAYFYSENLGTIENNGSFINNAYVDIYVNSPFNNFGTIENMSTFILQTDSTLNNYNVINNNKTLSNTGTIQNSLNGKINNSVFSDIYNNVGGTIYNYNGGTITNNGYFQNDGTINNADGSSTCGTAIINGSNPIIGNVPGNLCPP